MRVFIWLLRASIFLVLFAFALNNEHIVQLHWFFGYGWRGPMVFVVLVAFGLGCAVTLLALLPGWWRMRRRLSVADRATSERPAAAVRGQAASAAEPPLTMPPRDGL